MSDSAVPANALDAARAGYAAGHYAQALADARALWLGGGGKPLERGRAGQLAAQAAYRLGEYGQARELLDPVTQVLGNSAQAPERFDLLLVAVVIHGELGHYADAFEALRLLHAHSARADSLNNHVRARGTAAVCLALVGDPWAALRLLAEAAEHLRTLPEAAQLEATVCTNHASVCLQAARMLRESGDDAEADATLAELQAELNDGHEVQSHLGLHEQRHVVRSRLGDTVGALRSLRTWRELQLRRHARQLEAQSRFLRLRLELEHLYKQPWRKGS